MIDIITGQLTLISPFAHPITKQQQMVVPNYTNNYKKFKDTINRIHTLQKSVGMFKSKITKIA